MEKRSQFKKSVNEKSTTPLIKDETENTQDDDLNFKDPTGTSGLSGDEDEDLDTLTLRSQRHKQTDVDRKVTADDPGERDFVDKNSRYFDRRGGYTNRGGQSYSQNPHYREQTGVVSGFPRIPTFLYLQVIQGSLDLAKTVSISISDKRIQTFNKFNAALATSELLTLADGTRPVPIESTDNPSGYQPDSIRRIIFLNNFEDRITIPADDLYRYGAEKTRTLNLVKSMINIDFTHIIQEHLDNGDVVSIYKAIKGHFKARMRQNIEDARVSLFSL